MEIKYVAFTAHQLVCSFKMVQIPAEGCSLNQHKKSDSFYVIKAAKLWLRVLGSFDDPEC